MLVMKNETSKADLSVREGEYTVGWRRASALAEFGVGVGGADPASQTGTLGVEFGKILRAPM